MGLYEDILAQTVDTLPLRELVTAQSETPVEEVVELLRQKGRGCATVIDSDGRAIGIFTDRVLAWALAQGSIRMDDPVGEHLEERWVKVKLRDPLRKVLDAMIDGGTRFVCVTDDAGVPVATTGQKGLMECISEYFPTHVRRMMNRVGAENISTKREGG